jgi:hypothetical protein
MDRYSLQESMSGADNEETMGSEDSATDPVITPPPPEVLYFFTVFPIRDSVPF